jgi:hypothetical protein
MLKSFLSKVLLKIAPKSKPLLINDLQSIDLSKGKDFNVSLTLASAYLYIKMLKLSFFRKKENRTDCSLFFLL